jgi:dienelactone hydrolase
MVGVTGAALAFALVWAAATAPDSHAAFDPNVEQQNFSKTQERQNIYLTPQYQSQLFQVSQQNEASSAAIAADDPERQFQGDLCARGDSGCAGDVRLYDWQRNGYGLAQPVLFTARNGATISGHVWATRAGPATRPGVVITNGSVQADEPLYWYAAQTLAKDGYVVLTFDPQGQGQSDTPGESPDQNEGQPAQTDGRPFFDGTEDALDFMLSSARSPYAPVPSCSTGTSHAAKQSRRVAAGLDSPYNPFWALLDRSRIGLAGHSYGAAGVSYIGQWDPRVKAIVAWDNLSVPNANPAGSFPPGEQGCPARPADRAPARITKPALGMTADYFLPPEPNTSQPDPYGCKPSSATSVPNNFGCKVTESLAYSQAGVDTGAIVIRGGSHLDFSFIPFPPAYTPGPPFGATLRGADEVAWYTSAWFDKYVKGDSSADARLLTNRWRHDGEEGAIDPNHDGNTFSFYYPSRLDFRLANGSLFDCEQLRPGCSGLTDDDGYPGEYSYLAIDRSPDVPSPSAPGTLPAAPGLRTSCLAHPTLTLGARRRGLRIVGVQAFVGARRVGRGRGRGARLRVRLYGLPGQTVRVRLVIRARRGRRVVRLRRYRTVRLCVGRRRAAGGPRRKAGRHRGSR